MPSNLSVPALRYPVSEGLHLLDADDDSAPAKTAGDSKSSGSAPSASSSTSSGTVLHAEARTELAQELTVLAHNRTSNATAIELHERSGVLRAALAALSRAAQRDKVMMGTSACSFLCCVLCVYVRWISLLH